jgi:hypothetical protein
LEIYYPLPEKEGLFEQINTICIIKSVVLYLQPKLIALLLYGIIKKKGEVDKRKKKLFSRGSIVK